MRTVLDVVAGARCVGCGVEAGVDLCGACAERVIVLTPPLCVRCGAPSRSNECPCETLHGFVQARSLVAFAEPARAFTLALKRRGSGDIARGVGTLLAELAQKEGLADDRTTITSVPGGPRSARANGFDHGELIARTVARRLGAPMARLLVRCGEGPRQSDVPYSERRSNVAGRFAARSVRGRVLLIDDVFTTGATAEACSLALAEAGADSTNVVTWARTLRKRVGSPRSGAILRS